MPMLMRLADAAALRPRFLLAGALAFTVVGLAVGGGVTSRLASGGFDDATMQSVQATDLLRRTTGVDPGATLLAVVRTPEGARSAAARDRLRAIAVQAAAALGPEAAAALAGRLVDPATDPRLVARDGRTVLLVVRGVSERQAGLIERALAGRSDVLLGGSPIVARQVDRIVASDLRTAELVAFPLVFLLSLWLFRGLVAALLPPLVGAVAIAGAFLGLRLAAEATELSVYALNLVVGMGLGLAIDYSLFVVSRYREELVRAGVGPGERPGPEVLRRTLATAGRTVLFSGLTVAAALASLLVFRQRFLFSMGLGGMLVALVAVAAALVALPAALALLGPRVNALSPTLLRHGAEAASRPAERGFWFRLAQLVMRRPLPVATATAALLLALGAPFLGIRFTTVDARVLPAGESGYQVSELLRTQFARSLNPPVWAAIQTPPAGAAVAPGRIAGWADEVRRLPGVADVSAPVAAGGGVWRVDIGTIGYGNDAAGERLVRQIRALPSAYPVLLGGRAAFLVDQKRSLGERLPWAALIVVLVTLGVLFALTGSLLLPLKAVLLNLLTISAVFGVLVLLFQRGWLHGLLGFEPPGAIDTTQPLMIAAIGFGLSTDYGVFLLSRIKEAHDAGLSDRDAVALGLERTGRIVTAAALLFVVAIGAFAASRIVQIKEIGIGTALAVVIDATLVRALLVPSLMRLLGRWNWWAPGPLARLHRRLGLREG